MAEINYTQSQQSVLDDKSKNLLVSASAGSGKTATIIQKIFNLVSLGEVDLEELLVITFTEAASAEMKVRLKEKLYEQQDKDPNIIKQIEKLPTSDISTIHSFCSKMIRKYFFKLDLNPNFIVLDEKNSKFLKVLALDKVIDNYSAVQDDEFVMLSQLLSGGRTFLALKNNILSYYDFLCAVEDREKYKSKTAVLCYDEDLRNNKACDVINKHVLSNIYYLKKSLEAYLVKAQVMHANYFEGFIKESLNAIGDVKYEHDFIKNRRAIINTELPKLSTKKMDENDSDFKAEFKPFLTELQDNIKDLKKIVLDGDEDNLKRDLKSVYKVINKFQEIETRFEEEYEKLKQKKNAMDFADLEGKFLKLLEFEDVKESIASNYKYIFVDEYQDINSVQEKILSNLLCNNKMVMVGDIKQSIYGFRNSSPEIFVTKSKAYVSSKEKDRLINLNENFRSSPEILNFVNSIFVKCMFNDFGGIDYKDNSKLEGKREYKKVNDLNAIEINIIKSNDEDEEESRAEEYDNVYSVLNDKNLYEKKLTVAREEGIVIAKRILNMIGKNYYDAKSDQVKKISFGDIAILSRSNDFLRDLAKILAEYQIPVSTNSSDNIYKNKDILSLLSILKLLNNSHDDISLSIVLRGFLGNFTFDEILSIRQKYNDEEFLYESFNRFVAEEQEDKRLRDKVEAFFSCINKLRDRLVYCSIYELLNFLQSQYDFLSYFKSLPDGANRYSLVSGFIKSFDSAEYNYDLNRYLEYVENYAQDAEFSTSLNASPDSVKLGTIHSSKGLEYPIVFLVNCGKSFSIATFREEILKDKDLGLGINTFDLDNYEKLSNIARNAIALNLRKQEKAEELRLLYVALTRAKNNLIIIGHCNRRDHCNLSNIRRIDDIKDAENVNAFLPWILSSLSDLNHKNLTQNQVSLTNKSEGFEVVVNVINNNDFKFDTNNSHDFSIDNLDGEDVKRLKGLFDYKFEINNNIALKNTVSSMLQEHSVEGENFNVEPKMLKIFEGGKEGVDAARLGTLYHKVMQGIDLKKDLQVDDINALIGKLNFDEKYKNLVSATKVKKCIDALKKLDIVSVKKEQPFLSYLPYEFIFKGSNIPDKILIQGVADLIIKTPDKNILIDYKTTKATTSDQLVEKYRVQLKLYKICLEKAMNEKINEVYIYSFFLDKLVKI